MIPGPSLIVAPQTTTFVSPRLEASIHTAFSPIVRECGVDVVVSQFGDQYFEHRCIVAGAASRVAPEPERRVSVDTVADWSTAFA